MYHSKGESWQELAGSIKQASAIHVWWVWHAIDMQGDLSRPAIPWHLHVQDSIYLADVLWTGSISAWHNKNNRHGCDHAKLTIFFQRCSDILGGGGCANIGQDDSYYFIQHSKTRSQRFQSCNDTRLLTDTLVVCCSNCQFVLHLLVTLKVKCSRPWTVNYYLG